MQAPAFWDADATGWQRALLPPLLAPASALYALGAAIRAARCVPERPALPVLCIGNAVAGGAGKTPTAMAVAELPSIAARRPHFLSRGHGGRLGRAAPVRVDPASHGAGDVGDEPLLLATKAPTWVARDRTAAGRAAAAAGAGVAVMDDGFQNPTIGKTLSILVVDGAYGIGNGRVLPAGPLREPFASALARADILLLLGADVRGIAERAAHLPGRTGAPPLLLRAQLAPIGDGLALAGRQVLAFAGIARPERLARSLARLGCQVVAERRFPDHHAYSRAEVEALLAEAERQGAVAVTTAKDLVRLDADLRTRVSVLGVALVWEDAGAADRTIAAALDEAAGRVPGGHLSGT
ncbi:MAG: tetraacyldisaccharide 4'-kinase [Alphaproteobacteria bacterium]|nr:tetraacyldisaccharide 4'-kinase [Alphaproteobacteria bacterium]